MQRSMVHNATELMDYIQQVGFLPLLYSGIRGFSADEAVDPDCRYVLLDDGGWDWPLWKWKGPIVTEGGCVYGKFFNKKAGFVSRDWWPDLYNWRHHAHPAPSAGSIEETILMTLREHGSLITRELRSACGFTGPKMRSRFDGYVSPRTLSIPATSTTTNMAGVGRCSTRPSNCWARRRATVTAHPRNRWSACSPT